jgi:methionyl aminopeptidase
MPGQGPLSSKPSSAGGEPRGAHLSRDGDGSLGGEGGDDDDDDDNNAPAGPLIDGAGKKKKKRKPKKKKKAPTQQSSPPRVPLSDLFKEFPVGEIQEYNTARTTAKELRFLGRRQLEDPEFLNDYRKAAEVHRQVRQWTQENVKPGDKLIDIANGIEDGVRALLGNQGIEPGDNLKSGMGFPTGLCLNHETAHYTPNPGQKDVVLKYEDVMKVDFGVQINGWIVDSAFTMSFDPTYDNLLNAVKDATNSGIKVNISLTHR